MIVTIPCACPEPQAHEDTVTLRDALSPRDAMAISKDIEVLRHDDPDATAGDVLTVLTEGYVTRGVEAWSLVGTDGTPLPVSKAVVRERLLSDLVIATTVGDVADQLYAKAVMLPLLRMASTSSPPTLTEDSTSAPTDSGIERPTPSTPSSISTIRTEDTDPTFSSLGGDSSFSPSLASVG